MAQNVIFPYLRDKVGSAPVHSQRLESGVNSNLKLVYVYLEVLDVFGVTDSSFFSDIIIHTNISLMYNINPAE